MLQLDRHRPPGARELGAKLLALAHVFGLPWCPGGPLPPRLMLLILPCHKTNIDGPSLALIPCAENGRGSYTTDS